MEIVVEIEAENDPSVDAKLVAICINEHRRPEHAVTVRPHVCGQGEKELSKEERVGIIAGVLSGHNLYRLTKAIVRLGLTTSSTACRIVGSMKPRFGR